jgi:hypothetical protein
VGAAGCDAGAHHDQAYAGPGVRILGLNVGDGRPMPASGVIQIAFDRYLLPLTTNRQSAVLTDGAGQALPEALQPLVVYDPVARTVTLTRPTKGAWLTPGQLYKVRFPIAQGEDDVIGFRALDRATLDPNQPLEVAFTVGPDDGTLSLAEPGVIPGEPASVSFCADVLPIFYTKCSAGTCHGSGGNSAAGLVLDTPAGVRRTAIDLVAHGSNTGALPSSRAEGHVFGVDMPIIQTDQVAKTGTPGNSWLMYKLELARSPTFDAGDKPAVNCGAAGTVAPQTTAYQALAPIAPGGEPSDAERARLRDYVLGREMPYPVPNATSYYDQPLTFQERETIRVWIARGAILDTCGECTVPAGQPDAGGDGGADAGADANADASSDAADAGDAADAADAD